MQPKATIPAGFPEYARGSGRGLSEEELREGALLERRAELFRQLVGTDDNKRLVSELDRFRSRRGGMRGLARAEADPGGVLPRSGNEAKTRDGKLRVTKGRPPTDAIGFGHTGVYVNVAAKDPFASALLRFKLNERAVRHLEPSSIVVARWDDVAERFSLIPASGFDPGNAYAYGRISRPGTYTAIGLPRDPRILTTLKLFGVMEPWLRVPELADPFTDRICQLILCADFMKGAEKNRELLDGLGLSPDDFGGGGPGGDICDQCLRGGAHAHLPELELLDLADLPRLEIKPSFSKWPFWPRPCVTWQSMGPVNVTGRVGALAIHPSDGNTLYAGTTGGGVWRTTNGGTSWSALMSEELSLAVGGLGIARSNPSTVYAATGEWTAGIGFPVDPVTRGVGVYRTTNGGADWDLCAPIPSDVCSSVAVDPTNPSRVFVGGGLALHRTTNGGVTWDIPVGRTNGVFDGEVSDVVIDPNDVDRVYIGVHRDGVYRSTDGGNTWTQLTNGIDTGNVADSPKIALGLNGTHGTRFVAVKMGERVYTSINRGTSFTRRTDVGGSIWYFAWTNVIAVDPQNEDVLIAGAVSLFRSTDGGATWSFTAPGVHSDNQAIAFDPTNHNHVYVATDGGIWSSVNNGVAWAFASRGLIATHFYNMSVSQNPVLRFGGAIQDDSGFHNIGAPDWSSLGLGEGGYVEYDWQNEQILYHDPWFTDLNRTTNAASSWTSLQKNTDLWYGEPLAIGRTNANLLLAIEAGTSIVRSTNAGSSWTTVLSPAGPSFTSVRLAPSNDQEAYAGTADGRIWHSMDSGTTWTELDTTALPNAQIQSLSVAPTDPRRVFVAFAGTGVRHLFRGDLDAVGNATWFDVSGAVPALSLPDLPLTGLALHPTQEEVVYVSTLFGVLRSVDGGDSWAPFDEGLPNAFVSDLDIRFHDRSLWASTLGRGIYRRYV
jgi:photosystem II stability/assembly factor-like uncharacterized protein